MQLSSRSLVCALAAALCSSSSARAASSDEAPIRPAVVRFFDDGGAIVFDLTGVTVRALEGPLDGAVRAQVGPGAVLASRAPLAAAGEPNGAK